MINNNNNNNQLMIIGYFYLKPLQFHELNGPNFRYLIKYKPLDNQSSDVDNEALQTIITIRDWKQNATTVKLWPSTLRRMPHLKAYFISVQSENDEGSAPNHEEIRKVFFAGQKGLQNKK